MSGSLKKIWSRITILSLKQADFSVRIEALPDIQVKDEVMSVVRSMFPNITVPEPTDFFFPRWHSNPLFRGSYSNWPPLFSTRHIDNLRSNVGRLFFAGEATSQKYFGAFCWHGAEVYLKPHWYQGFLHGAYFEGLNAGQIIAERVNSASSTDLQHFLSVTSADEKFWQPSRLMCYWQCTLLVASENIPDFPEEFT